jgi:SAM-dependent methyltransferase
LEVVRCELCGVDETTPYAEENGYRAVRCVRCGLLYVNPRPTIDEMKVLYDGLETKIDVGAHIRRRDVKTAQARWSLRTIRREKPRGRLLEVGSAAGYLLFEAKKLGYEVQGLDITHPLVEFSRQVLGVPTHEGTLRDAPFEEASFDVVYMRNVLSHLAYPRAEYAHIRSLLRPGGVLIFETGNVAELTPEVAGTLELPDHLYLFGEQTIRRLLELTGFSCRSVARYGLVEHLGPVRALGARLPAPAHSAERSSAPSPKALELPPSTLLGRLEGAVGTSIRYGLGRLVPHQARRCSLVVVAERAGSG